MESSFRYVVMRITKCISIPVVLLAILFIGGAIIVYGKIQQSDWHLQNENCQSCHLARNKVTADNASKLVASQEKLCAHCHANAIKVSHPSGFSPKHDLPEEFPLDWKGDMTCSSCHNIHEKGVRMLRGGKSGKELCLSCHNESFFKRMPDHGSSIFTLGHMSARADEMILPLDLYSLRCMECHEDQADAFPVFLDRRGIVRHSSSSVNHPIGSVYKKSAEYGGYRDIEALSQEILLPKGKVSCVSCHKGYSEEHGELVLAGRGISLCMECHDL